MIDDSQAERLIDALKLARVSGIPIERLAGEAFKPEKDSCREIAGLMSGRKKEGDVEKAEIQPPPKLARRSPMTNLGYRQFTQFCSLYQLPVPKKPRRISNGGDLTVPPCYCAGSSDISLIGN